MLIHKGGNEHDLTKWRPITISSVDFLIKNLINLNPYQRGFLLTPGTFINVTVTEGILRSATSQKRSAGLVFLDVSKAFDSIDHVHLCFTINSSNLRLSFKHLLINLWVDNVTRIHVGGSNKF